MYRTLKSLPGQLLGSPPIDYSHINERVIHDCVRKDDPTILEVGCNCGSVTLWLLEMFKSPRLYCFEPDPRAMARFKASVGERSNVTLFEMALSDREGTVTFFQSSGRGADKWLAKAMPQGWDLSGSIKQPRRHLDVHPGITFDHTLAVPTSTLDVVCEGHGIGPVDFLWLDVQGAELDVFRGGPKTLATTRYVYSEYNDRELYEGQPRLRDLIRYLSDFELIVRYPGDALFRNTRDSQAG
jgi:FkbM family methyltransferase